MSLIIPVNDIVTHSRLLPLRNVWGGLIQGENFILNRTDIANSSLFDAFPNGKIGFAEFRLLSRDTFRAFGIEASGGSVSKGAQEGMNSLSFVNNSGQRLFTVFQKRISAPLKKGAVSAGMTLNPSISMVSDTKISAYPNVAQLEATPGEFAGILLSDVQETAQNIFAAISKIVPK